MMRTNEFYLLLLEHALIEIRALPVEGDLETGPKLADILHNMPGTLRFPWTEEREQEMYAQTRAKAQVHGLADLLDRWESHVLRRLAQEAKEAQEACTQ